MSFTTPKTWAFGEVLTSTDMNTYVRDNTAELKTLVDTAGGLVALHSAAKVDTFSSTSATYTVPTGLTVTFTPTDAANRLIILASLSVGQEAAGGTFRGQYIAFFRDGSNLLDPTSPGSRTPSFVYWNTAGLSEQQDTVVTFTPSMVINAGATTSTTIDVRMRRDAFGATHYLNRGHTDANVSGSPRSVSHLWVAEVKV